MRVGDLVWARWHDGCMGIVIDITFDDVNIEYSYRVKWWWHIHTKGTFESREYIEDLVTKEEKCSKQEI
tara:strand:- start:314 stop:520 length:207 start_codon:yes stop_codon:yes gene_type:complete